LRVTNNLKIASDAYKTCYLKQTIVYVRGLSVRLVSQYMTAHDRCFRLPSP